MDRVRGFVRLYPPQMCLAAGEIVADGTPATPHFEFLVLTGRPLEQRRTLLAAFTNLIVEHLGSPRAIPNDVFGPLWVNTRPHGRWRRRSGLTCGFRVCFSFLDRGAWNPLGFRDGCATVSPVLVVG